MPLTSRLLDCFPLRVLRWTALAAVLFLIPSFTRAQQPLVLQALESGGRLSWTFPTNTVVHYQVEWASDAQGPWHSFSNAVETLSLIAPTSNAMVVRVPMFYRLSYLPFSADGAKRIPAGSFRMGDTFGEGFVDERPVHTVSVSEFFMDSTEVPFSLWTSVHQWAIGSGYILAGTQPGLGKAPNHPVQSVIWYDAVKWCNARSERAGLTPCYYTDAGLTTVYRTGKLAPFVNWAASGYRLPTEAEWQKAARGGLVDKRFPWGDTIAHTNANYFSSSAYAYDISPTRNSHPAYDDAPFPYTSPVASFAPNGYGLHDMTGNVYEWVWDWYSNTYYGSSPATDPRGPGPGDGYRVFMGGSYGDFAVNARMAYRGLEFPNQKYDTIGFRCVRNP